MRKDFQIRIYDNKVDYRLEVKSKFTIIRGDSGTGKTTLIDMLTYVNDNNSDMSGVHIESKLKCALIDKKNWREQIEESDGTVFFMDENLSRLCCDKEFVSIALQSHNYFVIMSNMQMKSTPYSCDDIYRITRDGKHHTLKPYYDK